MNNEWEKEFEEWMKSHDDICGGLDSAQIAPLKDFIRDLLKREREKMHKKIINYFPSDRFMTPEITAGYNAAKMDILQLLTLTKTDKHNQ